MIECGRVQAEAPGLAALRPDDPERLAAFAHARGCAGCARALREADRLQSLLAACEREPLPAGALERGSRAIHEELRREARRRAVASAIAVSASVAVFVAFARHRSRSLLDGAIAAVLWALAVLLAATASRRPVLVAAVAVAAAMAAAAVAGAPGPLAPSLGVECVATELAAAAAVVGAAWLALRGGTRSPAPASTAAAAAAGALAGAAALQVTCGAHGAAPHLLAFHAGGVVLAAATARLLWRSPRRAAA